VGPVLRSWGLRHSPDGVGDGGALGGGGGGGAAVLRRTGTAVAYAEELGKGINHSRAKALESKSKGEQTGFTIGMGKNSGDLSSCRLLETEERRGGGVLIDDEVREGLEVALVRSAPRGDGTCMARQRHGTEAADRG
jgi:hypothetical protein